MEFHYLGISWMGIVCAKPLRQTLPVSCIPPAEEGFVFFWGGESTLWGPELIVINGVVSPVNMALYMGNWCSFIPISGAMGPYL